MPEKYPIRRDGGQTVEDMAQQMRRSSAENKLNRAPTYGEISNELKRETLDRIITQQQATLAKMGEGETITRVDLHDLKAVRSAANNYLEACKLAGTIPGISGLSASLGYSRQWICKVAEKKTEVGAYLSALFAAMSSCLESMGLARACSEPVSIFLMKNSNTGLTDRMDITAQAVTDPTETNEINVNEILSRYNNEVIEDDAAPDSQDAAGEAMPFED